MKLWSEIAPNSEMSKLFVYFLYERRERSYVLWGEKRVYAPYNIVKSRHEDVTNHAAPDWRYSHRTKIEVEDNPVVIIRQSAILRSKRRICVEFPDRFCAEYIKKRYLCARQERILSSWAYFFLLGQQARYTFSWGYGNLPKDLFFTHKDSHGLDFLIHRA